MKKEAAMGRRRKRGIFILIPAGCILLLAVWFYFPIHRSVEMTVCNLNGETAEMKIEVSFYRRLLKENAVRGTIVWNGVEYLDEYSKWGKDPDSNDASFLDSVASAGSTLLHKKDEGLPRMIFLNAELPLMQSMLDKIIVIGSSGGYDLETVDILYHDGVPDEDGHVLGVEYVGPASNQDEAQKLYQAFFQERVSALSTE